MNPSTANISADAAGSGSPSARRSTGLARRLFAGLVLTVVLGLAALMLIPAAFGFQRYVIVSGSMTGTYDRGSLVYDKVVPTSQLRVGDVITYTPPRGSGPEGKVTHRIHSIGLDRNGNRVYHTKGDANSSPDPWQFTLDKPTQPRVVMQIPYVGWAFAALAVKQVRMLVIGLPALLIALSLLAGMWREAGEEARRRRDLVGGGEQPEVSLS
jgi:signal peptidase